MDFRIAVRTVALGLALVLCAGAATLAATTRTFTADGVGATREEAAQAGVVGALRDGARQLTGRLYSVDKVRAWLERWDEFGLSKRQVDSRRRGDDILVTVDVSVDEDEFRAVVMATPPDGVNGGSRGLVMVIVPEMIILQPAPDPAAETAIRQAFLVAGYEVADRRIADANKAREVVRALERGDADAVKAIQQEYGADFIAYGEAFAEEAGRGQWQRCRATGTCELHVVSADTAREVAAATGTGAAESETILQAGKLALKASGEKAAATVLAMMKNRPRTAVQVVAYEVAYYSTSQAITAALQQLVGQDYVKRPRLDLQNKTCTWDISADIAAADVAAALEALSRPRLQILEVTGQKVQVKVTG
jgi:hypothetical protein